MKKGKLNTHRQEFRKDSMDIGKNLKGVQMITHSQGELTIWLRGSCTQNGTKNTLITFLHSYNQIQNKRLNIINSS